MRDASERTLRLRRTRRKSSMHRCTDAPSSPARPPARCRCRGHADHRHRPSDRPIDDRPPSPLSDPGRARRCKPYASRSRGRDPSVPVFDESHKSRDVKPSDVMPGMCITTDGRGPRPRTIATQPLRPTPTTTRRRSRHRPEARRLDPRPGARPIAKHQPTALSGHDQAAGHEPRSSREARIRASVPTYEPLTQWGNSFFWEICFGKFEPLLKQWRTVWASIGGCVPALVRASMGRARMKVQPLKGRRAKKHTDPDGPDGRRPELDGPLNGT